MGSTVIAAICFGSIFGVPFIIWGVILIVDRDRTWQRNLRRGIESTTPRRTSAWDRRQIFYGSLLIFFGVAVLFILSLFNYLAQSMSPSAPF